MITCNSLAKWNFAFELYIYYICMNENECVRTSSILSQKCAHFCCCRSNVVGCCSTSKTRSRCSLRRSRENYQMAVGVRRMKTSTMYTPGAWSWHVCNEFVWNRMLIWLAVDGVSSDNVKMYTVIYPLAGAVIASDTASSTVQSYIHCNFNSKPRRRLVRKIHNNVFCHSAALLQSLHWWLCWCRCHCDTLLLRNIHQNGKYIFHYMIMPSINFDSQFCSFDFHTMHFSSIHVPTTYSLILCALRRLFNVPDCIARMSSVCGRTFLTIILCKKVIFHTLLDDNNVNLYVLYKFMDGGMVCVHLRHTFTAILLILCALSEHNNNNSNNTFYLSLDDYVVLLAQVNSRYVKIVRITHAQCVVHTCSTYMYICVSTHTIEYIYV